MPPTNSASGSKGPIFSLPTPFTSTFDVDHAGITKSVDGAAKAGIKLFMLTSGNGEYATLSYDEIKAVTRTRAGRRSSFFTFFIEQSFLTHGYRPAKLIDASRRNQWCGRRRRYL